MLLLSTHGPIPIVKVASRPSVAISEPQGNSSLLRTARIHPATSGGSPRASKQNDIRGNAVVENQLNVDNVQAHNLTSVVTQSFVSTKDQKRFARKSARFLYTAEFVLLVKYVEAIVPAIYSAFKYR